MMPDNVLSTLAIEGQFLSPRNITPAPLIDYERGGVALNDGSQGLDLKDWRGRYIDGDFVLDATGVEPTVVHSVIGVTEFGFTFDQNMRVFIAYVDGSGSHFYWYDSLIPGHTTTALPAGTITPKCSMDDKRGSQLLVNDIILAYVRNGNLYSRQQRDRYETEYLLQESVSGGLIQIGMNDKLRFQFLVQP
jgi:hypothetical protein